MDDPRLTPKPCDFCGKNKIFPPFLGIQEDTAGTYATNIKLICANMGSVSREVTVCVKCKAQLMDDFQKWIQEKAKYGGNGGNKN